MRKIAIGVILGGVLSFAIFYGGSKLVAQQKRLELHGKWDGGGPHIWLVCDTGNGTLIYTTSYRTDNAGIAVLPNGCDKKP